jgi:hypothetical protein
MQTLTKMQAYRAMFTFLDRLYDREPSEPLGDFLSDIQLDLWGIPDTSGDPAELPRWINMASHEKLSAEEAFSTIKEFVHSHYLNRDLVPILESYMNKDGPLEWNKAVQAAIQGPSLSGS